MVFGSRTCWADGVLHATRERPTLPVTQEEDEGEYFVCRMAGGDVILGAKLYILRHQGCFCECLDLDLCMSPSSWFKSQIEAMIILLREVLTLHST